MNYQLILLDKTTHLSDEPQKIFGNIHRVTTPKSNVNYEAVAYVNGRCVSHGYALILSVTDRSVKIQLVGNTSYVNFFTTETFIDEMDLGYAETPRIPKLKFSNLNSFSLPKTEFLKAFGSVDDTDMVFFGHSVKIRKTSIQLTHSLRSSLITIRIILSLRSVKTARVCSICMIWIGIASSLIL